MLFICVFMLIQLGTQTITENQTEQSDLYYLDVAEHLTPDFPSIQATIEIHSN
ncbi:MAG: hypothetical protein Q8R96_21380 [Bacteroidota bacterium]|nr:hypothetical protein [Bacteroidota bacterium]